MKGSHRIRFRYFLGVLVLCAFSNGPLHGATFIWTPTALGTGYDWNNTTHTVLMTDDQNNWGTGLGGAFPNAPGDTAHVNNDIEGAQTIRLQQAITVGILNIGDANGTHAFTVSTGTGTNSLTFDTGLAEVAAQINVENNGALTQTISAPISLVSDLKIALEPITAAATTDSGRLTLSGAFGLGSQTLTLTGGLVSTGTDANQFNMSGVLSGDGTIINNSNSPLQLSSGGKTGFTGTLIANGQGTGGSNTGTFALDASTSVANSAEIILNGVLTGGSTQLGGSLHSGASTTATNNPSQRFTSDTMTFNGGTLRAHGWIAPAGTGTAWQRGEEFIQDTIATMNINSGYSRIEIAVNGMTTAGTVLTATELNRNRGTSLLVSHQNGTQILGGAVVEDSPRFFIGNVNDHLIGGTGATPTTMKIIPWIGVTGVGGSATTIGNSAGFSTYGANGLRLLDVATEYATSITAGPTENVNVASVAVAGTGASATVNSLRYTGGNTATNIGAGNTLNITSGGVFFLNNNAAIGASGNSAAGTLNFGAAEGVIWSNASNVNTIGAEINGSMGLSKAGTGTLILTGDNTYSELTYVGGGTLQVGDGTNTSNLGLTGDVTVASGALLSLFNSGAISDDATLTLEQFGLFNGKLNLNFGINETETVSALFFGDDVQLPGTWGSTASGAEFKNDTFFSGAGIVTVVPEPGSVAMLLCGATALLGLRRRRA